MSTAEAAAVENQLDSRPMKTSEAVKIANSPFDPLASADGLGGALSTIFVAVAAGAVVFGLIASGSGEPLLLTLLAILAMLGLFLLFAVAAGLLRLGVQQPIGDVLKVAFDSAPDAVLIASADGAPLYRNAAFDDCFGRSNAGPFAALEAAVRHDPDAMQVLFRLTRAAERGESRQEELRLKASVVGRDYTLRVAVRTFAPANARDDDAARLISWQFADVTEDFEREAGRIGALEQSLAAFDAMPAGFVAVSAQGELVHINATFETWLGYAHGTLRSRAPRLSDIAGEESARQLALLAADPDDDRRAIDLDLTRNDGRIVSLTLFVEPLNGGFTLTAINRLAPALTAAAGRGEARMAPFFHSAPFGIATLDGAGRIASCNTAFSRMVLDGRPTQGLSALDALCVTADAENRTAVAESLARVLAGRGAAQPIEVTAGDQKQFTRRVYMAPIANVSGGEAASLYVVDATDEKALEARFAQAQKMEAVGKLAGGIAHDFNNVLTAIIGFSDLLLQTKRPSDPDYKDIRNIQSAANRAAGLVANLLGFSRKQTQQVSILNLGELATEMTPTLRTAIGEKITLKLQSERDLWTVRADSGQIYNVILNLSVNARDAMPGGGKLTISTRNVSERDSQKLAGVGGFTPGEYVVIEVADTGVGMSPEVMTKIFEPFFTTKAVGKGTGLGLASVYGIVKQSGGFILPESEIGKGTAFKVYLPRCLLEFEDELEVAAAAKATASKRNAKAVDLTGTGRVLLVEDEVEVRQFAVRALKRQGYDVLEAADGVEALEIMNTNDDVDIVVSDVVMPEMDGPTLFKELRKRNPSMKVIFVSGYPNEAFREQLGEEDFAFLPKPFSLPQLAAKVKEELAK
ncbi:MAG: response regulator [Hyphomicrobium sp.]